jgi:hypothetical protein
MILPLVSERLVNGIRQQEYLRQGGKLKIIAEGKL